MAPPPGPPHRPLARARQATPTARALLPALGVLAALSACSHRPGPAPAVPTVFERARPASLLVLPPINDSPDVRAPHAVMAQVTRPLAEGGYYVLPVSLVAETFHHNGLSVAHDAHAVPPSRLREIFGADAALYLRISDYGTRYTLLRSETRVQLEGRIVDLRSGATLWQGQSQASSAEEDAGRANDWLLASMFRAVVRQVTDTVGERAHGQAAVAAARLLAPRAGGLPPGPRAASAPAAR